MELYESNYWRLTVSLQKCVGLWYFQRIWKNYLSWFYIYTFTISFMIAMGVRLYNEIGLNLNIVVENVVGEMYLTLVFMKVTVSVLYKKKMKYLYEQIAKDWKHVVDDEELEIMHKYTEVGRKIVVLYSVYMIVGVGTFLVLPIAAPILDLIIPLANETRPKALPYYAEYGIDQEKYYYPLMTQAVFGGIGTISVFVTFDLGFILTVQHVIALFALVNHRLYKASKISRAIENRVINFVIGDRSAQHYTVGAINLHQIVMGYVDLIENCYCIVWLIVLFLNMIMLGGGLTIILLKVNRPEECFRYIVVFIAGLIHFYYIFLPGQKIINSSLEVFDNCYACKWYNFSDKCKQLIKIMMIRSLRRSELTGGKMFVLCMDTYCNMMKTGFSIFTLLR